MKKQLNNKSGFTLIELVIVVIILAILASVALPRLTRQVNNAQATEAINALGAIVRAGETCFQMNNGSFANCTTWGTNGMPADPGGVGKRFSYALSTGAVTAGNGLPATTAGDLRITATMIDGAGNATNANDNIVFNIAASNGAVTRGGNTTAGRAFANLNNTVFNQ